MKKMTLAAAAALILSLVLLAGCGSTPSSSMATASTLPAESITSIPQDIQSSSGELVLTLDELAYYDGKDGRPAYVAVDGVIYDVTGVPQWANGEHNGQQAGQDLTEAIKNESPHGLSVLDNLPVVGKLAS